MENTEAFSIAKELSTADFGDKRLTGRVGKLAELISKRPGDSFPEIAGDDSVLESMYRFFGNAKVTPKKILSPHIEATIKRASFGGRIIIAHDRTELLFGGKSRQNELGCTQRNNQGFSAHFCLALCRESLVRPLGVLGFETIFRKPGRKPQNSYQSKRNSARESTSWFNAMDRTESLFPTSIKPIHVADRGADDFDLFSDLIDQKIRFVIRVNHNRNCKQTENCGRSKLFDLLNGAEVICEREVKISKRNPHELPGSTKRNPPRAARTIKLQVSAQRVRISRVQGSLSSHDKLELNVVHAYEKNPPEDADPVDWKLYTLEPIETQEDLFNIIDDYRARWMIEEFHKAIKSGCSYEKRQLESRAALLNVLALLTPIAWQLLLLRTVQRHEPQASANRVLSNTQIEVLRAVSKKELPERPSVNEALLAIAALGGHIRNNGKPGWQVLWRGMEDLLKMEIAWVAAKKRCDQS